MMAEETNSRAGTVELLARVDERTRAIQSTVEKMNYDIRSNNDAMIQRIEKSEEKMTRRIADIEENISERYVHKDQFTPIQKIVYAVVGLILTTVILAVVNLVVNSPVAGG